MKRKALFAGTFDPFTIGHYSLIQRALSIIDEIIIAIGVNTEKHTLYSLDERIATLKNIYADEKRISIASYHNLTSDFAKESGVDFLLRGIRNTIDFEKEKIIADMNHQLSGIETIFLFSEPEYAFISSSLVRELVLFKKDISNLIPHKK